MRNGILLIDKPAGMTSATVVARVKRMLKAARVGHAGTLDPDATGLLIVLINGATRVASYAADGDKVYSGTMKLGVRTSTDDTAGEVLETCDSIPDFEQVQAQAVRLTGVIEQVPPKVSSVKIGGKRAHRLTRRGVDFEIAPRSVNVKRFELSPESRDTIRYVIECTPGTYVRALARDLGDLLGCGGAAATIRRERSGHIRVEDAVSLEAVSWDVVRDWSLLLPGLPRIELPPDLAKAVHNGQRTSLKQAADSMHVAPFLGEAGLVLYTAQGLTETMGILAVREDKTLDFELNIGLNPVCT